MVLWPLLAYFITILILVVLILVLSNVLGQRHREPATGAPYEGGVLSEGTARARLSAKFYLTAMFFVIFDLEAAFVYAWAVAGRVMGWQAYWGVFIFICVLAAALVYLWRVGALDWGTLKAHARD